VGLNTGQAMRLALRRRDLCESTWRDKELAQAQQWKALGWEGCVTAAMPRLPESTTTSKVPSVTRTSANARVSCTGCRTPKAGHHPFSEHQLLSADLRHLPGGIAGNEVAVGFQHAMSPANQDAGR
jgi:hypothetical protein